MSSSILNRDLWRRHCLAFVTLIAVAWAVAVAPAHGQRTPSPNGHAATPAVTSGDQRYTEAWVLDAIRPELRDQIVAQMPEDLSSYRMDITLEPQGEAGDVPSITGHLALSYTNTTGAALDSLPFRLYANGPDAERDAQIVSDVTVDGSDVEPALSESDSVLEVPFAEPLATGASAEIEMDFAAFLPIDSVEHYGIFGYNSATGTWALAHWYPVIAGRDPSTGWMLDHPSRNGDPIFTDTALYDVTIESAPDWVLATTGVEHGDTAEGNGTVSRRFVSGPVRDFTIIADQDLEVVTEERNGITVNSWYNPGQERTALAVAEYAANSVTMFDELISPYPYREIDLAPVDMKGAAGCEFPQLIYLALSYYDADEDLTVPNSLDFTVAHEVVHQWFYGLVGSNQYAHAYIDEGLTNFLSAQVYFERQYGPEAAALVMDRYIRTPFERGVADNRDQIVDQPTDEFPSGRDYVYAAYSKSPLGFAAIWEEIGDEAFFTALTTYVDEFIFRVAEPADLLAAFETASGEDLDELWSHWFEEADGAEDVAP